MTNSLGKLWSAGALVLALLAEVRAQTVTFTPVAQVPLSATARIGNTSLTDTRPAGALPLGFVLSAVAADPMNNVAAQLSISASAGPDALRVRGSVGASGSSSLLAATVHPIDIVVMVQASSPVRATLFVDRVLVASAGSAVPALAIDVQADGSVEFDETSPSGSLVATGLALGPIAVPVRLQTELLAVAGQHLSLDVILRLVPENQLAIGSVGGSCTPFHSLLVAPSFVGTGLRLTSEVSYPILFSDLMVVVIGTNMSPVLLPSPFPGCVFMPSSDVLLVLPPASSVDVPLPPSVRPVTLWAQGVVLLGTGTFLWTGELATTAAHVLTAF